MQTCPEVYDPAGVWWTLCAIRRHRADLYPTHGLGPVGALSEGAREELVRHLEDALSDHLDDEGVVCVVESYVVFARREEESVGSQR